jgi:hypothetical protein
LHPHDVVSDTLPLENVISWKRECYHTKTFWDCIK